MEQIPFSDIFSSILQQLSFEHMVARPGLRCLSGAPERRQRLHAYLSNQEVWTQFPAMLEAKAAKREARIDELLAAPDPHFLGQRAIGHLPRKVALAPVLIQLKTSAVMDRLEAKYPRGMFYAYWGSNLAARLTLLFLAIGLVAPQVGRLAELAPDWVKRISPAPEIWTQAGIVAAITAIGVVTLSAIDELRDLDAQHRSDKLHKLSDTLFKGVTQVPSWLSDIALVVGFLHWGKAGRALTILRVGYRAYWIKRQLPKSAEEEAQALPSAVRAGGRPEHWYTYRHLKDQLQRGPTQALIEQLRDLQGDELSPAMEAKVQRLIDLYALKTRRPEWLSQASRTVVQEMTVRGYRELLDPAHRAGEVVVPEAAEPYIRQNPVEAHFRRWHEGNHLGALTKLPAALISPRGATRAYMPWGSAERLTAEEFAAAKASLA